MSFFRKLKLDNIKFVELRNSPFYIANINHIKLSEAIIWLSNAINKASQKYGIIAGLLVTLTRHEHGYDEACFLLDAIKESKSNIIIGMDISGDERVNFDRRVARIYKSAKYEYNLGISIHAGETWNIENVLWTINECEADRIGHGYAASKSKEIMELIREKEICIEVSMISGIRTGNVKSYEEHPVREFIKYNVPFVLCSDNPCIHNCTLSDEYRILNDVEQNEKILSDMYRRQKEYSFLRRRGDIL